LPWRNAVQNAFHDAYPAPLPVDNHVADTIWIPDVLSAYERKWWKRNIDSKYICTLTDKSTHAFAFICRQHYTHLMRTHMQNADTFTYICDFNANDSVNVANILKKCDSFTNDFVVLNKNRAYTCPMSHRVSSNFRHANPLPITIATYKCHKLVNNLRFISAAGSTVMSPPNILCSDVFNQVLIPLLKEEWLVLFKKPISPLTPAALERLSTSPWFINATTDAVSLLNNFAPYAHAQNLQNAHVSTLDFSTMYTAIRQRDAIPNDSSGLRTVIARIIDIAFNAAPSYSTPTGISVQYTRLKITNNFKNFYVTWTKATAPYRRNSDKISFLEKPQLLELVLACIDNSYSIFGGKLYRQTGGVPMGSELSTVLANLYLHYYERNFIMQLINNRDLVSLEKHMFTNRYIDDLIAINNDDFNPALIYPAYLNVELESCDTHGHYLDIAFAYSNTHHRFHHTVHDKRREEKYRLIPKFKYTDPCTGLSNSTKLNVISTEFYRYFRICSSSTLFFANAGQLLYELYCKGHNFRALKRNSIRVLSRFRPFYNIVAPNPRSLFIQLYVYFIHYCKFGLDIYTK
jgi:hypothetical protein